MSTATATLSTPAPAQDHANVLGVRISPVNMRQALAHAGQLIQQAAPAYICVTSVHGIMEAQHDPSFLRILNNASMNLPDGMPLTWIGRLQGHSSMDRVFGPDFMLELCRISIQRNYRHFLYGGGPGIAQELKASLESKLPGLQIVGTYTPPFRPLNPAEELDLHRQIKAARPHILWTGLSTPKQERFMATHLHTLRVPFMAGVGAAFDYHTGRIHDCQPWIKRAGMQWLHRLLQDPGRLTSRYLRSHPLFVCKILKQILTGKLHA